MAALGLFFLTAIVGSIVLALELPQWIAWAVFFAAWIGSAATLKGSTLVKVGGGLLVAIAGLLVAAFVKSVFIGAAMA